MALPHSTTIYHGSTRLYYTLAWLYLALLDSTTLYHGSTPLMHRQRPMRIAINTGGGDAPGLNTVVRAVVIAAQGRGWDVVGIEWGYDGLFAPGGIVELDSAVVSGMALLHSTKAPIESTTLYHDSTWLYLTLPCTLNRGSTWLYLTLLHSTMALLHCNMALLDTTWLYYILPWLHFTLLHSTMALLGSTWLYYTIPLLVLALLIYYTLSWLYYILPWIHVTLYLTLLHSTMALSCSTTFYHGSTWLYMTLLHSIMALLD